jgi:hypothetical protein
MGAQIEYSVAEQSGGRVMLCAVYTVQMETRSAGFLVEPQNQDRWFVNGLASKPLGRFLLVWLQDRWHRCISALASKLWFVGCATKPMGA